MKRNERGFALIEVAIAMVIVALTAGVTVTTTFQVFRGMGHSNDYMTAVRQVQSAGYRVSSDAQMAQSVSVNNEAPSDFLLLVWTERSSTDELIYHSIRYFVDNLTDGVGKLKRSHWSSAGVNEQTLVAEYIYFDPDDPANSTQASLQGTTLTVQLTASFGDYRETREYKIVRRPTF
ncbi:MAG: prepilin-type N-terminal cleavage/methylation domain-containing protein [Chloroflexi bacterium]|nr:prepilin-type N-terminal cleavage/methylation domain-containing protein [Chloroflexota bacterium]